MLYNIWILFTLVWIGFLIFPFITVAIAVVSGRRKESTLLKNVNSAPISPDYGCIITAYKTLQTAMPAVEALLKQEYQLFHIYLVADDCPLDEIALLQFPSDKVSVLYPPDAFHAKVKSMQFGVSNYQRPHTHAVIFDADNLAAANFLETLTTYFRAGYRAVQGRRAANNLDTVYACADATGEIYKNYIERYVPYLLGASATIAGSAMAVEVPLFTQFLYSPPITKLLAEGKVVVAEDKMLQNFLVQQDITIAFATNALVYDEKVKAAAQVKRQRTRWLYSYFQNIPNSAKLLASGILGFNANRGFLGAFSLIPPLFILLFGALIMAVVNLVLLPKVWFFALIGASALFIANILWVLYLSNAPTQIWTSLWGIPFFIFNQLLALLHLRRAKYSFLHTQHSETLSVKQAEE